MLNSIKTKIQHMIKCQSTEDASYDVLGFLISVPGLGTMHQRPSSSYLLLPGSVADDLSLPFFDS
jgi:hypothetical protein